MAAFLVKHGYCGRRTAAELLARLRAAPAGTSREALTEALRDAVLAAAGVLQALNAVGEEPRPLRRRPPRRAPGREIFTSLPRSGQVNAAQVLAEWGDCREAYAAPDSVAALAGVTPVTSQSGKHRSVHFRWACNKRFRTAVTTFADNSRHASPWAAKIYDDARASGKDHPHATHPGPRLDPRHLPLLARRHPLRPRLARSRRRTRQANCRANRGLRLTQGVSCPLLLGRDDGWLGSALRVRGRNWLFQHVDERPARKPGAGRAVHRSGGTSVNEDSGCPASTM